mgnify:FL=1
MYAIILWRLEGEKELEIPLVVGRNLEDMYELLNDNDFINDKLLSLLRAGKTATIFMCTLH